MGGVFLYYNKVEISGVNTAKLKVLKESEKTELLRQMRSGDPTAREKLINGNLRLVLSVIQRFSGRGENPDDLFQVGCIGLMKAIDNFSTDFSVRFSTYAVPMIMGELRRYLRDQAQSVSAVQCVIWLIKLCRQEKNLPMIILKSLRLSR